MSNKSKLLKKGNVEGAFLNFIEKREVGEIVQNAYLSKVDPENLGENFLNETSTRVGLFNYCYAASGFINCLTAFELYDDKAAEINQSKLNSLKEGLLRCAENIYIEITKDATGEVPYRFWPTPYIDRTLCKEVLEKNTVYQYVGAMTWVMSILASVLNLATEDTDDETKEREREEIIGLVIDDETYNNYAQAIKFCVKFFLDNQCEILINNTKILGWGYTNNDENKALAPSLFFTYSVLEAFNDFDDNVYSIEDDKVKNERLLNILNEGITDKDKMLHIQYKNAAIESGKSLWAYVKDKINSQYFDNSFETQSLAEVRKATRSSALFNTIYLVLSLIYSYANKVLKDEEQDMTREMRRAVQNVQVVYDDFLRNGMENIVDRQIVYFSQKDDNQDRKQFAMMMNEETILASSLIPTLLRAHSFIAYYIHKYPSKDMSDLVLKVEEAALKEGLETLWLWEGRKYDLLLTVRYIEAISDFYRYYEQYERDIVRLQVDTEALINEKQEGLLKAQEKRHQEELKKQLDDLADEYNKELDVERENARIEERKKNVITNAIDKMIDESLNRMAEKYVENALKTLALEEKIRDSLIGDNAIFEKMYTNWLCSLEPVNDVIEENDSSGNILSDDDITSAVSKNCGMLFLEGGQFKEILEEIRDAKNKRK